jgi:GNAT superfamily N-acetyltransferase
MSPRRRITAGFRLPATDAVAAASGAGDGESIRGMRTDPESATNRREPAAMCQGDSSVEGVTLRDGSRVLVRQILPSDKRALQAAFEQLSEHSRRMRFHAYKRRLSDSELAYFTEVDHVDHAALIAVDAAHGELLGVARYIRLRPHRESAEAAVAVVDHWQRRGVGTVLLSRVAELAREHGISRFEALVLNENRPVTQMCKKVGGLELSSWRGVAEFAVELPPRGQRNRAARRG